MIDNAGCLEDLRVPPVNRLEKHDANRKGQYLRKDEERLVWCFEKAERELHTVPNSERTFSGI